MQSRAENPIVAGVPAPGFELTSGRPAAVAAFDGRSVVMSLALLAVVFAVFGQTVRYRFVNYDDGPYVYENEAVQGGLSLKSVRWAFTHAHSYNWHPLTTLTQMADCQCFGLNAGAHHANNVVLHAATAIVLFLALQALTSAFWRSALVAFGFAVHPLRVESVAWIAERKDVLSGLFFALTLLAYARSCRRGAADAAGVVGEFRMAGRVDVEFATAGSGDPALQPMRGRFRVAHPWSLVFFSLALLAKPMAVTTPFVLLLLDYWPLQRAARARLSIGRLLREKLPFFALAALSSAATLIAQQGAIQPIGEWPWTLRLETAVVAYAVYLRQLFYPAHLSVFYPMAVRSTPGIEIAAIAVALVAITALVVIARQRHPWLFVGWLWYAIARYNLGLALSRAGRADEAAVQFARAAAQDSSLRRLRP